MRYQHPPPERDVAVIAADGVFVIPTTVSAKQADRDWSAPEG
jgi:hypothetical protein